MTMGKPGERETLKYKLQGNRTDLGAWGHEFLRSLAGEIGQEYSARLTSAEGGQPETDDLQELVAVIVPHHLGHNAEAEAVDLLVEARRLPDLLGLPQVDEKNYERVCLYLLRLADYAGDPDDLREMLRTALAIYRARGKPCDALRLALRLDDRETALELLQAEGLAPEVKKQMCYLLARHGYSIELADDEEANEVISNSRVSELFLKLAKDLDVMEPKTPEDIYKSHLAETAGFTRRRHDGQQVDSARANLAATFVNAFVNAGYGKDTLMTVEDTAWLYKNKDHGMLSAAASLGMILLWNVEEGLTQIDKFVYSGEDHIKAGAALAVGVVTASVRNESDPALALLAEHLDPAAKASRNLRLSAVMGLGLAYAGTAREDVLEVLLPVAADSDGAPMLEVALAALSLGLVCVGTCHEEVGSTLVQRLMEASDAELDQTSSRFLALGLGLLFLNKAEAAEAMLEAVRTVAHPMGKYAELTLETCAYAGTGDVLRVQRLLHLVAEPAAKEAASAAEGEGETKGGGAAAEEAARAAKGQAAAQSVAVLGIALITMGEAVGAEMALRTFDHLLHYADLPAKRAVPLALALLHVSDPDYAIVDTLSRLSHDPDADVAQNATLALGVLGAGTNNSRIAGLLRQLSEFYAREAGHLFAVRIAQGLLHAGKGLVTLSPFHSDRLLLSGPAVGGLLTVLHCCLDLKNTLLDKMHYLLYYLSVAMRPRMLMTVDENGDLLPVSVRVGQAVETVGQAGRPKTITGFQTHTTPVLLGANDRAELADAKYLPVSAVLEDVCILVPNPEWEEPAEDDEGKKKK